MEVSLECQSTGPTTCLSALRSCPALQSSATCSLTRLPHGTFMTAPASFNLFNQLLTLATNSIALCRGAHLGSLKLYQKKFLKLCFTKYESASNLRGPTSLEAQAADKRAWELIGELVNIHAWKLDDALHEVTQVRADLSTLLAPRAQIPKHLFSLRSPGRTAKTAKAIVPLEGQWQRPQSKHDSASQVEEAPSDRTTRGGKGRKAPLQAQASGFPPSLWTEAAHALHALPAGSV